MNTLKSFGAISACSLLVGCAGLKQYGPPHASQLPAGSPLLDGLDTVGHEMSANAKGRLSRRQVFEVSSLSIGQATASDVRVVEMNEPLSPLYGADGLLGMDLFRGLVLDIDFRSRRLVVFPPGHLPYDFTRQEWITVPLLDTKYGFSIEIGVDDHPEQFRMVLDSGAIAYRSNTHYSILDLPRDLRERADTSSDIPVYRANQVRIGNGSIGPMPFLDLDFSNPPRHDGFLGNALLIRHRVVIDPANGVVFISKQEDDSSD